MSDHQPSTQAPKRDGFDCTGELDWARPATRDPANECSSDGVLDPGDTHDKGERSLCVGEAA